MVRYALYPHRLIGYYYIENDEIICYKLNPNYLEAFRTRSCFAIGYYVNIDQTNVRFPTNNPYRTIYSRDTIGYSIHEKRLGC